MNLRQAYDDYQESWAAQDWDRWQLTLALDYRFSASLGQDRDRRQTLAWSQTVFAAFPDYRQEIVALSVAGTVAAAELVCSGTSVGTLPTGIGRFPATGRRFTVRYCKVISFDEQSRVARDHQYLDLLELLVQLGHLPGQL